MRDGSVPEVVSGLDGLYEVQGRVAGADSGHGASGEGAAVCAREVAC